MSDFTIFAPVGMQPDPGAIEQMENVMRDERAVSGALMADHHKGYSMPIGGVVAYKDAVSPTGVGFDIGCGNKAVRTNINISDYSVGGGSLGQIDVLKPYMTLIQKTVSFGLGRSSGENVDHELFDNPIWSEIDKQFGDGLKAKARQQLGTVGSGNHYVDVLVDENDGQIWVANHFGSRGLGHTIATGFNAYMAGLTFTDKVPESDEAVVISKSENPIGFDFYIEAMRLAGDYAYAGRDYVADQVLSLLGAESTFEVHNHHNYAWKEKGLWVVRKGATPLTREPAFIGGSMGDVSVIVKGKDKWIPYDGPTTPMARYAYGDGHYTVEDIGNLNSAPHGAGRIMSRTKAAGKMRKMWVCQNRDCDWKERAFAGVKRATFDGKEFDKCPRCAGKKFRKIRMRDDSTAAIDWTSVRENLQAQGITVLGAGADEAPGVYKPLKDVLAAHDNIEVMNVLRPLGVVMAGDDTRDPYKD